MPLKNFKTCHDTILCIYNYKTKHINEHLRDAFTRGALNTFLESEEDPLATLKSAFRKARMHDVQESLTTDFTPMDMKIITRQDKERLEELAATVLYEAFPDRLNDFHDYEAKKGKDDILVKMADLIEWSADAIRCYSTSEFFNEKSSEDIMEIISNAREKMQDYPEAYNAFGNAYISSLEFMAEKMMQDIGQACIEDRKETLGNVIALASPF